MTVIEAAGIGLAVEKATEALKKTAHEIVCSNDEDAIDCILKNCLEQ